MILDSEEQRRELLALTKIAFIQGTWEKVAPTFQAIGELQVKIMQAELAADVGIVRPRPIPKGEE